MASTNKCLAQSNKTRTGGEPTEEVSTRIYRNEDPTADSGPRRHVDSRTRHAGPRRLLHPRRTARGHGQAPKTTRDHGQAQHQEERSAVRVELGTSHCT